MADKTWNSSASLHVQDILNDGEIQAQLSHIKLAYACLTDGIRKLSSNNLSLSQSLRVLNAVQAHINEHALQVVKLKMEKVIFKNSGLLILVKIDKFLSGEDLNIDINMSPFLFEKFKYTPVTSVDVEP